MSQRITESSDKIYLPLLVKRLNKVSPTPQWWASAGFTSASSSSRNPSAPLPTSSPACALELLTSTSAFVGSAASYAVSSAARSAGSVGAFGTAGGEKTLTAPTCASFA